MNDKIIKSFTIPAIEAEKPQVPYKRRSPIIRGIGVTVAENRFADQIVRGMSSIVDAYRNSYPLDGLSDRVITTRAYRVFNKPRVVAHIETLRSTMLEKSIHTKAYATNWVLGNLERIVTSDDKDRVAALRLVMQHYGMISESAVVTVEDKRSAEELSAELERKLAAVMPRLKLVRGGD